ncbi:hypothetical protein ACLOJK_013090 [Asimina triloba]
MAKPHSIVGFLLLVFAFSSVAASPTKSKSVGIYELKKGNFSLKLTNWGVTVMSVILPDAKGNLADVALGFDTVAQYHNLDTNPLLISSATNANFGGVIYTIAGGRIGFSSVIWTVKDQKRGNYPSITFTYRSFDGEQGFPGDVDVSVTYKIVGDYDLSLTMKAKALNKPTPISLGHHIYWNLGGHNSGDILSNTLQIFASHYTPVDKFLIPTGEIAPVKGTPYDFLQPDTIGRRIDQIPPGYDINYAIDGEKEKLKKVAYLKDYKSGRALMLWATAPGMQLYTSNWLKVVGKGGYEYQPHAAVCLETLGFPDSVNHPNFPSQIVNPGEVKWCLGISSFQADKMFLDSLQQEFGAGITRSHFLLRTTPNLDLLCKAGLLVIELG